MCVLNLLSMIVYTRFPSTSQLCTLKTEKPQNRNQPKTTEPSTVFPVRAISTTTVSVGRMQELQLHLGVLQQHAALMIGGPNATPCPICHKLVFGGEALMEHMKNTHKDPNASGVASKC